MNLLLVLVFSLVFVDSNKRCRISPTLSFKQQLLLKHVTRINTLSYITPMKIITIIIVEKILDILYSFGAVQGSMIHYLTEIQNWETDHNSLERPQTGPSQLSWDWLCVNTSFLIHSAEYKLLTVVIKMPLMCQEQTTVQFLWEHGSSDKEWLQAAL